MLNYGCFVDNGIILNKNGSFLQSFYFCGQDLDSASPQELAALSAHINQALIRLGSGWLINVDTLRVPSTQYVPFDQCCFPTPTSQVIDDERRQQYEMEDAHYENVYAMTFTYQPPPEMHAKLARVFIDDDSGASSKKVDYKYVLSRFKLMVSDIIAAFSATLQMRGMNSSELLTFLHTCLTGERHPVRIPLIPFWIDAIIGSKDFFTGIAPRIGERHVRTISVMGFPAETQPGILDRLNKLGMEYRWSTRFIPGDPTWAEGTISKVRRNWFQKRHGLMGLVKEIFAKGESTWNNADAMKMTGDADAAVAEASSGIVRYGYYTTVIVLADENKQRVEENAKEVAKVMGHLGFPSQIETINAVEAFIGTMPGEGRANVRRPILHTLNLADLIPTTAVWPGQRKNPCDLYGKYIKAKGYKLDIDNIPPLMYAATSGNTPFRLCMHDGDVAHGLVLGPIGAGKSTLLCLLEDQQFRYPDSQIFAFDKGNSMFVNCMSNNGTHYSLGSSDEGQIKFCPFGELDSEGDRLWAKEYAAGLARLQGLTILPHHREALHDAVERLAQPGSLRSMTNFVAAVQNMELKQALGYYTQNGNAGHLLDARSDDLADSRFLVFEMGELLNKGEAIVLPILSYLFRRIEKRLEGRPTLIIIDEAWSVLANPVFAEKFEEWLVELRKKNAGVIFATQSLTQLERSLIKNIILETCPTKILLANPEAMTESVAPLYRAIGLNNRQIEMLAMAQKKRDYFIVSPQGRRMVSFNIGKVALAFCGVSYPSSIKRAKEIMAQHGDNWIPEWMRECGVNEDWIAYWRKLAAQKSSHANQFSDQRETQHETA
ncbi:MAG: transporter [Burkholderia sp.]